MRQIGIAGGSRTAITGVLASGAIRQGVQNMTKASHELARKQLDLVLGFFGRVDAKASFVFAMDTGLLALLAVNARLEDVSTWFLIGPAILALALIIASLYFVYRCSFPYLKGGTASLVYFREIARRTEARFVEEFVNQSDEDHARDVLGQVWRNSEILKLKFDAIKIAFILTAISLIPWTGYLAAAAAVHAGGLSVK